MSCSQARCDAAERRHRDHRREAEHQHQGRNHDRELQIAQLHREPAALEDREPAMDQRRHRLDARALRDLHVILQEDRHADRRDQRRQAERPAQRPIGDPLDRPAVKRGEQHRDDQHDQQRQRHEAQAGEAEHQKRRHRDKGADHVDLAMREIDHADDAVDHRVADRDQPVDRPQRQAVDQLLQKICHPRALRRRSPADRVPGPADLMRNAAPAASRGAEPSPTRPISARCAMSA